MATTASQQVFACPELLCNILSSLQLADVAAVAGATDKQHIWDVISEFPASRRAAFLADDKDPAAQPAANHLFRTIMEENGWKITFQHYSEKQKCFIINCTKQYSEEAPSGFLPASLCATLPTMALMSLPCAVRIWATVESAPGKAVEAFKGYLEVDSLQWAYSACAMGAGQALGYDL